MSTGVTALATVLATIVVGYGLRRVGRYLAQQGGDVKIEKLIAANAAHTSTRRRWTDFDPSVREETAKKRAKESDARARANRIASAPLPVPRPAATPLTFGRKAAR